MRNQVVPSDLYNLFGWKAFELYSESKWGTGTESELKDGYFCIDRRWKKGDKVAVHFDMETSYGESRIKWEADRGRIAVERGPDRLLCGMAG